MGDRLTPDLLRRMLVFIEECAMGSRLDADGLNHDDNCLMTLAAHAASVNNNAHLARQLTRHAMVAQSLWMEFTGKQ